MSIEVVFETHATSLDNEAGVATGWLPGRLSVEGREQARELGERRRDGGFAAVFSSDLTRAVDTATIAMAGSGTPLLLDWRLRECDYGERNGSPVGEVRAVRAQHVDVPYPGGESWRQAVDRAAGLIRDLRSGWTDTRVLVIGHVATRWAFDHVVNEIPLEQLADEDFVWRPGWTYHVR